MKRRITISAKTIFKLLKKSGVAFLDDKGLKLSASLSYYTTLALAPLLILVISIVGFFFGKDAVRGHIFYEINNLIGSDAALQIQDILKNLELSGQTTTAILVSILTLLVTSTTVFSEIQDSINSIWKVKAKPKKGWLKIVKDRLLSSSLIIGIGFLMMISLLINGLLVALNEYLKSIFPEITVILFNGINLIMTFGILSLLFGVVFKVLPDASIEWKDVRAGSFFTAGLFMLGRYLILLYIQTTGTGSAYGAAGSIIVLLVWLYYTSAILYFGAEFTKFFANLSGKRIRPSEYAVYVKSVEVELDETEDTSIYK
ncbi:YihY/virulence factor BrkB family protein [Pustulibacterium marinum]|nr:YihY/virulence factor BrkB family protein [Pustulibacterium marinum]